MGAVKARIDGQIGSIGPHYLSVMDCASCGEVFAVTHAYNEIRRRDGRGFHCPNGHSNVYSPGPSPEQQRIKELERQLSGAQYDAKRQKEMREWAEARVKGANIAAGKAKAQTKRLLERTACGMCPHCRRTFQQLAEHMKSKHPDVLKSD